MKAICEECNTTEHVGEASGRDPKDTVILCLSCSVLPKYRRYNIWSLISENES